MSSNIEQRIALMRARTPIPTPMTPQNRPEHHLVEGFNLKWIAKGNSSSASFRLTWSQIFYSMDEVITMNQQQQTQRSIVDPANTGAGKTQSMLYYLAHMVNTTDTRALVVTNLKTEAVALTNQIEAMTYTGAVAVYNTDINNKDATRAKTLEETYQYPILVISHEKYKRAVQTDNSYTHLTSNRDLICIDEELTVLTHTFITALQLREARTVIEHISPLSKLADIMHHLSLYLDKPQPILKENGRAVKEEIPIEEVIRVGKRSDTRDQEPTMRDVEDIDTTIAKVQKDSTNLIALVSTTRHVESSEQVRANTIDTIRYIERLFTSFAYTQGTGKHITLIGGALHIPMKCQIVFDATAITNQLYTLHKSMYAVNARIPNTRNYKNVNLHILNGTGVGQTTWIGVDGSKVTDSINIIINELRANTSPKDQTLVIVHNGLELALQNALSIIPALKNVQVAHWGALTGLNDWRECNKLFIFGFNIKPSGLITNGMIAYQGTEHIPPFAEEPDPDHKDLEEWVEVSELSAELVQAMNRVRSRTPIDEDGNCLPTDMYVVMPKRQNWLDYMQSFIVEQMPNINILEWKATTSNDQYKFEATPMLGKTILLKIGEFGLTKGESIYTTMVGVSLGYKTTEAQESYRRVLRSPEFLDDLKESGYAIAGTDRKREFRSIK